MSPVASKSSKKLPHVLFVATEVAPYASVGGLSQVMYFLPKALKKRGVNVLIFMPKYGTLDEKKYGIKMEMKGLKVPTGEKTGKTELICNVKCKKGTRTEPTVYFLENQEYYEQRANVYGYNDDHVRFALLSRGAIEFVKTAKMKIDVLHANDWHTGYTTNYLRTTYGMQPFTKNIASVMTVHNLKLQGPRDYRFASPLDADDGKGLLPSIFSDRFPNLNPLKRGIIYSDLMNTVSETHSREIMTEKYGEGMHQLIKELRTKVFGVLNGLDYTDFDPGNDKIIKKPFTIKTLKDRAVNKEDLQKEFSLKVDPDVPLLSYIGRLDDQKGLSLIEKVITPLLTEYDAQFIVMGKGNQKYHEVFSKLEKDFPERVGTHLMRNFTLPRKIFAGTDLLLLPSKFEPGGIVVMEGMRYGAVPIVRATGGLDDSVEDYDPSTDSGCGFKFQRFQALSFYGAIVRALEVYKMKKKWKALVTRAMKKDFSWENVAVRYIDLYERAMRFHSEQQSPIKSFRYPVKYSVRSKV